MQINVRFENDEFVFSNATGGDYFALTLKNKIRKISPVSTFIDGVYPWNDIIRKCTKSNSFDNLPKQFDNLSFENILTFIQAPVLEKLFRCNLNELYSRAYNECRNSNSYPKFLKNNAKLSEVFHLNNKQLKILNEHCLTGNARNRCIPLEQISGILVRLYNGNISCMDDESFKDLLKAFDLIDNNFGITDYFNYGLKLNYNLFIKADSLKSLNILIDSIRTYNSISKDMKSKDENLSNYQKLFKFSNVSELNKIHNFLIEVKNIEAVEAEAARCNQLDNRLKQNKKLLEEREKLYYEDQDYVIYAPEKMLDIVWEGKKLQHCVAGYVSDVASGKTTILFLRKKPDIEISFYTIELKNNHQVYQIHGFGNKWLGNDPDAIPTVVAWAEKNKLKVSKEVLCGTGNQYGYSGKSAKIPDRKSIEIIKNENNKENEKK